MSSEYEIVVTDVETGEASTYDYSKKNWAGRYACMRNGLVHCWVPCKLSVGLRAKTSGRYWELRRRG